MPLAVFFRISLIQTTCNCLSIDKLTPQIFNISTTPHPMNLAAIEEMYPSGFLRHVVCMMLSGRHGGLTSGEVHAVFSKGVGFWKGLQDCTPAGLQEDMQSLVTLMAEPADRMQGHCTRLLTELAPYLVERYINGLQVLTFVTQFQQTARERYLQSDPWKILALPEGVSALHHLVLAAFFRLEPLYLDENSCNTPNIRKLDELPWQQIVQGNLWDALVDTLTDIRFLEAKVQAGMIQELYDDYLVALEHLRDNQEHLEREKQAGTRMRQYIDNLMDFASGRSVIPPTIPSVKPLNEREQEEKLREYYLRPSLTNKIRPFLNFLREQRWAFEKYGHQPGFVTQQAINWCSMSPLKCALGFPESYATETVFVSYRFPEIKPPFHPFPILQQTLHYRGVNTGRQEVVIQPALTPDLQYAFIHDTLWTLTEKPACKHFDQQSLPTITADGKKIVTAQSGIEVLDVESGSFYTAAEADNKDLKHLAITPDAGTAVTGHLHGELRVFDLKKGTLKAILKGHRPGGSRCVLSANGKYALSCSYDNFAYRFGDMDVRFWNIEHSACIAILQGHKDYVSHVDMTPDGRWGITAANAEIFIWDLKEYILYRKIYEFSGYIGGVSISADGEIAAAMNSEGTVWLYDVKVGKCLYSFASHVNWASFLKLSADGRSLVTISYDATLRKWDLANGVVVNRKREERSVITCTRMCSNNRKLITSNKSGRVEVTDITDGSLTTLRTRRIGIVSQMLLCRDQHTLILNYVSRIVKGPPDIYYACLLQQISLKRQGKALDVGLPEVDIITNMVETTDGSKLIYGARFCSHLLKYPVRKADPPSGMRDLHWVPSLVIQSRRNRNNISVMAAPQFRRIEHLSMHPSGRYLLSGSYTNHSEAPDQHLQLILWDIATETIVSVAYSSCTSFFLKASGLTADGQFAYIIPQTYEVHKKFTFSLYQLPEMNCVLNLIGIPTLAKPSPDGRYIFACDQETFNQVCLRTGRTEKYLSGGTELYITDNGRYAVVKRDPYSIGIMDIDAREWVNTFCLEEGIESIIKLTSAGDLFIISKIEIVIILSVTNLTIYPPIVTPYRMWIHADTKGAGHPDPDIKADCKWCGETFVVPTKLTDCIDELHRVAGISKERTPLLTLPDSAWEDERLISSCPKCGKRLKYNPFVS